MFRLRALGGASLEENGAPVDTVGGQRKALALLTLLAIARAHGLSRERLAAYLWPESDSERARGALKQALHVVRRQLGSADAVLGTSELRLNPAHVESDVGAFLDALDAGRLDEAVRLYQGPFLDGFHLPGAPEFEQWASTQRDTLERGYASALERLASSAEERGEPAAAVGWLRRLQLLDPLSTRVTLRLMRALDAAGERSAALRCAQVHETLLRAELDSPPDPEVAALAGQLRDGPPRPAAAPVPTSDAAEPAAAAGPHEADPSRPRSPDLTVRRRRRDLAIAGAAAVVVAAVLLAANRRSHAGAEPAGPAAIRSVAVLPFTSSAEDSATDHLSYGLTEQLSKALSRDTGLRVAPRTVTYALTRRGIAGRAIAESLGVASFVEGSVHRAGDRVVVEARLTDARNGAVLWTRAFGGEPGEFSAAHEEIAAGVLQALTPQVEVRRPQPVRQDDPVAYDLYLRGRHTWRERSREGLQQAVVFFEAAIERDPGYAAAHAGLAATYVNLSNFAFRDPAEALARAEASADRALALDPELAEAHAAKGFVLASRLELDAAEAAFRRALELEPGFTWAHHYYTLLLMMMDRTDEALEQNRLALASDPLSLPANATRGIILAQRGDLVAADRELDAALSLSRDFGLTLYYLAVVRAALGRDSAAAELLERTAERAPGFTGVPGARALVLTRTGRRVAADSVIAGVAAQASGGDARALANLAFAHAAVGRIDAAYELFDDLTWDVPALIELRADPLLAAARSDPRYPSLLRRIGADR